MRTWKVAAFLAIGGLIALGSQVSAADVDAVTSASPYGHTGPHGDRNPEGMMTRWTDELGLTAQQQSDLQIIMGDYAARLRDLAQLGRDTAKNLLQTAPDDPGYRALTDEASALAASSAAELIVLLSEMRGKLHSVLTPEQRQRFRELMESRHAEKSAEE